MKNPNKRIAVLDDGGQTYDRYTILDTFTGDVLGASDQPFAPHGFGQHCGNVVDNYMHITFGYGWRKTCNVRKVINAEVERYLSDCSNLDKRITFDALPPDVQKFALQSFK